MPISRCALSDAMFLALERGGALHSLLERVLADETLNMEFRGYDNAINIYYRGGSLFRVEYTGNGYVLSFDTNYCANQAVQLSAKPSLADAIRDMPFYKQAMDFWFAANHKYEREFAQTVVRDNNRHGSISHATDYYIISFEYPYLDNMSGKKSYFDMTAIKWLSQGNVRKDEEAPRLALIEMKYGDGALAGTAGLAAHLQDFDNFLSMDSKDMQEMVDDQAEVFQQKCELGLIPDMKNMPHNIKIMPDDIEVIFILANHDPEKTVLAKQLSKINPLNYPFTIKFAFASMMGYGLYEDTNTMMTLAQLKNRLSCQNVCGDDVPNFYENE